MEILFLHEDYSAFLDWLYEINPALRTKTYEEQFRARLATHFAGSTRYIAPAVRERGHEVRFLVPNAKPMQMAWAREHDIELGFDEALWTYWNDIVNLAKGVVRRLPQPVDRFAGRSRRAEWYYRVLRAQIRAANPDVIINMGLAVDGDFLAEVADGTTTLVGTLGVPSLVERRLDCYDLLFNHVPTTLPALEELDVPVRTLRHCFGTDALETVSADGETIPVSFVGSFTQKLHTERIRLLERLCRSVPIEVWAPSVNHLPDDSPIRECYRGQAWGRQMYDILSRSKVTVNAHIDEVSIPTNVRLYEATGLGTCLVTDNFSDFDEVFEPGSEVVTYDSPAECIEEIERLLEDATERAAVAEAGQRRTLSDHTCDRRAARLLEGIRAVS